MEEELGRSGLRPPLMQGFAPEPKKVSAYGAIANARWRAAVSLRNLALLPVALLVRAPILIAAYGLIGLGRWLEDIGGSVPGLRTDDQRARAALAASAGRR